MSDHDEPRYVNRSVPQVPRHERDHVIYTCSDGETHRRLLAYEGSLGLQWHHSTPVSVDELPEGADPRLWRAVSTERGAIDDVKRSIKAAFPDAMFGTQGNPTTFWVKLAAHPSCIEALDGVVDVVTARYQEDEAHLS